MNDSTQTLLRSVLKIGAGIAVANGWADQNNIEVIVAGLVALAGVVWGVLHRTSQPSDRPSKPTTSIPLYVWLLVTCLAFTMPGCGTTPATVAYKTEVGVQTTVSAAMTAWGDYVATKHPSAAQEQQVKALYEKYQASAVLAIDATAALATLSDTNSLPTFSARATAAESTASAALADLVNALKTFGVKL